MKLMDGRELLLELVNVCVWLRALRGGDALFERFNGRFFDLVLQLSFAEIELDLLLLLQRLPMQRALLSAMGRRWVGWCSVCALGLLALAIGRPSSSVSRSSASRFVACSRALLICTSVSVAWARSSAGRRLSSRSISRMRSTMAPAAPSSGAAASAGARSVQQHSAAWFGSGLG